MRDLAAPFLFSLEGGQTHLAALFYFPFIPPALIAGLWPTERPRT